VLRYLTQNLGSIGRELEARGIETHAEWAKRSSRQWGDWEVAAGSSDG